MSPTEARFRNILRDPARLRSDEPLAVHTTFRIGGPADLFVTAHAVDEVRGVLSVTAGEGLPLHILGNGSNLLVSDDGVRGVVLALGGALARFRVEGDRVSVGAGYSLPKLASEMARRGLGGLSFACAIPGSIGAGVVINAGAHGGEMSQVVEAVRVIWADGREGTFSGAEMGFRYRTSDLQGQSALVTEVSIRLTPTSPEHLAAQIRKYLDHRRATQPLNQPNAGSIFKNPPGDFAGRLIEAVGCKGWHEGDAQVSPKHSNFIVNLGRATARDVVTLMHRVRAGVVERFGICLEPEIRFWGPPEQFLQ